MIEVIGKIKLKMMKSNMEKEEYWKKEFEKQKWIY